MQSLTELTMHNNGNVLVVGPHLGGKTTILRDIVSCYDCRSRAEDIFLYEYEHCERMFIDLLPLEHMMKEPVEAGTSSLLIKAQQATRPVLIMDDCVYGVAFHYKYTMELIAKKMNKIILSLCYPFRVDIDFEWIVVLPCEFASYTDQLYNQYLKRILTKEEFQEVIQYINATKITAVINKTGRISMYDSRAYWRARQRLSSASFNMTNP